MCKQCSCGFLLAHPFPTNFLVPNTGHKRFCACSLFLTQKPFDMKENQNGTNGAATTAKADEKKVVNGKPTPQTQGVAVSKPKPTNEELAKERLAKKVKLETLYEDIEQLEEAVRQFDSIQSFGEITLQIQCGGRTRFKTSRDDTLSAAHEALRASIKEKLALAYRQLGDFQF